MFFQWIIIKLNGNVCLLNPLAKFNNQPDPMKFSVVMALELTRILKKSNFVRSKAQIVFIVHGYNILPSLLTN